METRTVHSLRDLYYILFRHKWAVILFFLAVMVTTVVGTFLGDKIYQSEAKLLIRLGRASVTLDPTVETGQKPIVNVGQDRQNEMNSELEILTSREVAEKVVKSLGIDSILDGIYAEPAEQDDSGAGEKQLKNIDKATNKLMRNLTVDVVKQSNIIQIVYDALDPKLAQMVLKKLIDFYLSKHISVHRTRGSHDFFKDQKANLNEALTDTEIQIKDIKNSTYIGMLEERRKILEERISYMQTEIDIAEADLAVAVAKVGALTEALGDMEETLILQEVTGGPLSAIDSLRRQVYEMKLKRQELLSIYTEDSIPVSEFNRRLEEAKEVLAQATEAKAVTRGLNENRQKTEAELVTEKVALAAFEAKVTTMRGQLIRAKEELKSINEAETRLSKLERDKEVYEENYRKYSDSFEQTRIDNALEQERISNINISQYPTYPLKPIRPRPLLNIMLGLVIATVGGVGLAFFIERLDHTLKTPEDIEEKLEVPALAAIPSLSPGQVLQDKVFEGKGVLKTHLKVPKVLHQHYEMLTERLHLSLTEAQQTGSIVALTSCHPGAGVSMVASQLALTLSRNTAGRVLLVDTNLKRPRLQSIFDANTSPGLADILDKGESLASVIQPTSVKNLDLLCAGETDEEHPRRFFESKKYHDLINHWKREYHFVVVDMPAVWEASYIVSLGRVADYAVMVIEAEKVRWEVAQRAKERLENGGVKLKGAILNKRKFYVPMWLYRTLS